MSNDNVNKTIKRFENENFTENKVRKVLIAEKVSIQSLKFTKKEFLEDQLLVQLIATFQKHRIY